MSRRVQFSLRGCISIKITVLCQAKKARKPLIYQGFAGFVFYTVRLYVASLAYYQSFHFKTDFPMSIVGKHRIIQRIYAEDRMFRRCF